MTAKSTIGARIKEAGYALTHSTGTDVFKGVHSIVVTQNKMFVSATYADTVFGCLRKIIRHTKKINRIK